MEKIILTDCDGVILNWESQFHLWMSDRGYNITKNSVYEIHDTYDIAQDRAIQCIEEFNTSAYIVGLPSFRDAISGVARLKEHGYKFIAITSVGDNPYTDLLRKINLENIFGSETFLEIHCLSEAQGKRSTLEKFKNSGLPWVEDLPKNAKLGSELGLNTFLIDHPYNQYFEDETITRVQNWEHICEILI